MEDIRSRLGDRIRFLRKGQKLSQEALALKAGLDRTYVASIESGNRNVSIINIERIATALNITLADFFDADEFVKVPTLVSLSKVADKSGKKYK
ncbi:MAG: helix-turn-helix transcriptional regulator [Clostridia bacterium]|nr:helix-turn-helix transcriptional regulator [Clostridia bacterium]